MISRDAAWCVVAVAVAIGASPTWRAEEASRSLTNVIGDGTAPSFGLTQRPSPRPAARRFAMLCDVLRVSGPDEPTRRLEAPADFRAMPPYHRRTGLNVGEPSFELDWPRSAASHRLNLGVRDECPPLVPCTSEGLS
jgi:hypothetical protein